MRLMIVDDHAGVRQAIRAEVATPADAVCECASGEDAVRLAQEFHPDAITMDVWMPGMTGFEATRAIRKAVPAARIIFVTSYDEPSLRKAAHEVGAADYIVKDDLSALRDLLMQAARGVNRLVGDSPEDSPAERGPAATPVEARLSRLERELRERECFPGIVAHELSGPLRIINRFTALMQHRHGAALPGEAQEYLQVITKHAHLLTERVEGLIALAASTSGAHDAAAVAMNDLVTEVWDSLGDDTKLRATFKLSPLPEVTGDRTLLRLAMENLLANAIKFSAHQAQPVIEVGATVLSEKTVMFVRDNGIGFDMRYVGRLFEPLSRLHSNEEFPGIGLGLALTRRIIQQHGGLIWAEAARDRGATFYFTIPGGETPAA